MFMDHSAFNQGNSSNSQVESSDNQSDRQPVKDDKPETFYSPDEIRILVLDDDDNICQLIRFILAKLGFLVDTVHNPAEMEKQLGAHAYSLLILDFKIPGISPAQMFGFVQKYQPKASVIVITAYPSLDSALQCLRARIEDYLSKPFEVPVLEQMVIKCLEKKGLLRLSNESLREKLGATLRERRKTLGLTLADLSKRTEISVGYLCQIELGKNSATVETMYRIVLGLNLRMAELFHNIQGVS